MPSQYLVSPRLFLSHRRCEWVRISLKISILIVDNRLYYNILSIISVSQLRILSRYFRIRPHFTQYQHRKSNHNSLRYLRDSNVSDNTGWFWQIIHTWYQVPLGVREKALLYRKLPESSSNCTCPSKKFRNERKDQNCEIKRPI